MSKYVKLEDAMEIHRQFAINGRLAKNIIERYEDLPVIDIVYCGECKHISKSQWVTNLDGTEKRYKCDCIGEYMLEHNFCSFGERKE